MITKLVVLSMLSILLIGFQTGSCERKRDDKWVKWGGPHERTNLVVFFKKGTTNDQIEEFDKNTLNLDVQPIAFIFRVVNSDFVGVGINFSTEATPEQREQLKKNIKESPIVYKVYEDVVPKEIKDL